MPELPEVETVKQVLMPQLCGKKIIDLQINKPIVLAYPEPEIFYKRINGAIITAMSRRGKYLMIHLSNAVTILVHLRMTGQLLCVPPAYHAINHNHITFFLDNGQQLRYIDVRRFGRMWLKETSETDIFFNTQNLGLEPFDDHLNASYLISHFRKRKITIKQGLLDQSVIAGIGNIYADEILYATGIHPSRFTKELTSNEWQKLAKAIPQILQKAIEQCVITPEEYLAGEGKEYRNTPYFKVYGKEGKACLHCGTAIERIKISGRSSHYCPCCQPLA